MHGLRSVHDAPGGHVGGESAFGDAGADARVAPDSETFGYPRALADDDESAREMLRAGAVRGRGVALAELHAVAQPDVLVDDRAIEGCVLADSRVVHDDAVAYHRAPGDGDPREQHRTFDVSRDA